MKNTYNSLSFNGYDVVPLKALYMQGLRKPNEIKIFEEMKNIANKEGIDIFVNASDVDIQREMPKNRKFFHALSVWAQDNKSFVQNIFGHQILWNADQKLLPDGEIKKLGNFSINSHKLMPRGGNYYLGYKSNHDKWLLINANSYPESKSCKIDGRDDFSSLFGVKPENIFYLSGINDDIDEVIRPIGYPFVLVNDYNLALKTLDKMKSKFPLSITIYNELYNYITNRLNGNSPNVSTDVICDQLSKLGFKPIKIGARFSPDINYMNALAFKNVRGGISYITNSTRFSYPELEYLEQIFDSELKSKVKSISDTYYVSGGKRIDVNPDSYYELYADGFLNRNAIMDMLANREGGIHCMTAEVPNFDKII